MSSIANYKEMLLQQFIFNEHYVIKSSAAFRKIFKNIKKELYLVPIWAKYQIIYVTLVSEFKTFIANNFKEAVTRRYTVKFVLKISQNHVF